jgi:hypothetical protein
VKNYGNHPLEDLAKSGYKLDMKYKKKFNPFFYICCYTFKTIFGPFLLFFFTLLAMETFKCHLV